MRELRESVIHLALENVIIQGERPRDGATDDIGTGQAQRELDDAAAFDAMLADGEAGSQGDVHAAPAVSTQHQPHLQQVPADGNALCPQSRADMALEADRSHVPAPEAGHAMHNGTDIDDGFDALADQVPDEDEPVAKMPRRSSAADGGAHGGPEPHCSGAQFFDRPTPADGMQQQADLSKTGAPRAAMELPANGAAGEQTIADDRDDEELLQLAAQGAGAAARGGSVQDAGAAPEMMDDDEFADMLC